MVETTETLTERRLREITPAGFETTLTDDGRLRSLANQDVDGVIDDTVQDYEGNVLTERNIIEYEIQRVLTSFLSPERTMELPGLGLEYSNGNIYSFAAQYKQSDDTPTGTIQDLRRAQSDDLVFTFATPQVYNSIIGASDGDADHKHSFKITGVSEGDQVTVIGGGGFDSSSSDSLSLGDDERMFFTGDFIDVSSGQSIFNRHEWVNVDGQTEDYGPMSFLLENRLSGANLGLGHGAHIKREAQLDFRAYEAGDAELWPVAFYMGPGHQAPGL